MTYSVLIAAFAIGAIAGSFLNVLVYRIPRGMSLIRPGSHCTSCKEPIKWSGNVPILSYILQWGRCSHCQAKIPIRYLLFEIISGILAVAAFWLSASITQWIYVSVMLWLFSAMIYIDFKHFILPDILTISAFTATVLFKLNTSGVSVLPGALAGAVVTGSALYILRRLAFYWYKKEAFGLGDVKLGALIGFILGWPFALLAVFFGFCLAAIFSLFMILSGIMNRKSAIPFGPFMIGGLFVFSIWGPSIVHWYLHLLSRG